jgi:hypothetical protein
VALVAWVLVERRAPDPVVPLPLLRDRAVAGGILANLLGGAARVASFVLVALLLQQVLLLDPGAAGLAMLPTSIAGFAVSLLLLPRMLARIGAARVAVIGLVLLAVAHLLLATVAPGDAYGWRVLPVLFVAATGVALSFTPTTLVITQNIPAHNAGVGSGMASSSAQLGGAIGIAVFGAVDAASRAGALADGASELTAAHAGLSAALVTAATVSLLAAAIALLTFPGIRPARTPGR